MAWRIALAHTAGDGLPGHGQLLPGDHPDQDAALAFLERLLRDAVAAMRLRHCGNPAADAMEARIGQPGWLVDCAPSGWRYELLEEVDGMPDGWRRSRVGAWR